MCVLKSLTLVSSRLNQLLERYSATLILVSFLILWYEVELAAVHVFDFERAIVAWWFTFQSLSEPTVGWIGAVFSHASTVHLLFNVGFLAVFGGMSEPHMRTREYFGFFVVVGFHATVVYVGIHTIFGAGASTMGASGAIYGFVFYGTIHYVRYHDDRLGVSFDQGFVRDTLVNVRTAMILLVPLVITGYLSFQLLGVLPKGRDAVLAHSIGALCGFCYDYVQGTFIPAECY